MTRPPPTVIAIDWSGDKTKARRKIWLAEAKNGQLVRLLNGNTREQISRLLSDEAEQDDQLIVGLDFAFSFPAWFCHSLNANTACEVWTQTNTAGEQWLGECKAPFWGRPGRKRNAEVEELRQTEKTRLATGEE